MDDHEKRFESVSNTKDFTREKMSKFDISSAASSLSDPESVLFSTCVVLSAASNVASLKFPDMTIHKVLASFENTRPGVQQCQAQGQVFCP